MGKIIAICNQKGGVGKTTTSVNLSAALGVLEKKVLILDTDPQANASNSLGFSSLFVNNPALEHMSFISVIRNHKITTNSFNVDLIPYFEDLDFFKNTETTNKLYKAISSVKNSYDYIIIDCTPFLQARNLNVLTISDSVIIPIQCDYYSLEGLTNFLKTIRFVQKELNKNLCIEGFLPTMFDRRLNLSHKVLSHLIEYFGQLVFKTIIHRSSKIPLAQSTGKSVIQYAISSKGAGNYLQLAQEIIKNENVLNPHDIDTTPTKHEIRKFNNKELGGVLEKNSQQILRKVLTASQTAQTNSLSKKIKDFDHLLGKHKTIIHRMMGSPFKNRYGNIWIYKIRSSSVFGKRYLNLHFTNDVAYNYETKWFCSY